MPILKKQIKIAVVDDHKLLRESVALLLGSKYNVFIQAENGNDFINKVFTEGRPDLVVLDVNMPEKDGFETASWIRSNHPDTKILVLTMYDSEDKIIKMFRTGANAYLLKNSSHEELLSAVESVLKNGYYFDKYIASVILSFLRKVELPERPSESILSLIRSLNSKELQIVNLINKGLTDNEIAERLGLSRKSIEYSRYKLMEKLQVKNRIELINIISKSGGVQI